MPCHPRVSHLPIALSLIGVMFAQIALGDDASHDHAEMIMLDNTGSAPSVDLKITADSMAGHNIHVITGNFMFTPYHAGGAHTDGTGHAHLYVDGRKVARIYGPWYHLAPLPAGEHVIRVTLNSNDHRTYAADGEAIAAEVMLFVP